MARILIVSNTLAGGYGITLEMSRRLDAAGHMVTYACARPVPDPLPPYIDAYERIADLELKPAPLRNPLYNLLYLRRLRRTGIEQLHQLPFRRLLQRVQPELVLVDIELHAYVFTAFAEGYPLLLISQWFNTLRLPGLPPVTTDLLPGDDGAIAAAWERRQTTFRHRLRSAITNFGNDRRSLLLRYARQAGFPPAKLQREGWPAPLVFTGLPVLHTTLPELEFPYIIPAGTHYVGPMVAQAPFPETLKTHPALARMLREASQNNQTLLYAVSSSMHTADDERLARLSAAVAERPDWLLIYSLGGRGRTFDGPTAPNVRVFDWLPQRLLLSRVACCIHHGGINTINECLVAGVPTLIYPGGRYDQPGCAARMRYHRAAVVIDPKDDAPAQLRQALHTCLYDEALRRRVAALRDLAGSPEVLGRLAGVVDRTLTAGKVTSV